MARAPRNLLATSGNVQTRGLGNFQFARPAPLAADPNPAGNRMAAQAVETMGRSTTAMLNTIEGRLGELSSLAFQSEKYEALAAGESYAAEHMLTPEQLRLASPRDLEGLVPEGTSIFARSAQTTFSAMLQDNAKIAASEDIAAKVADAISQKQTPQAFSAQLKAIREGYVETVASVDPVSATKLDAALRVTALQKRAAYDKHWKAAAEEQMQLQARQYIDHQIEDTIPNIVDTGNVITPENEIVTIDDQLDLVLEHIESAGLSSGLSSETIASKQKTARAEFEKRKETTVKNWIADGVKNHDGLARLAQMNSGNIRDASVRGAFHGLESAEQQTLIDAAKSDYGAKIDQFALALDEQTKNLKAGLAPGNVDNAVETLTAFAPFYPKAQKALDDYGVAQSVHAYVEGYKRLPSAIVRADAAEMRARLDKKSATPIERETLIGLEKLVDRMETELVNDPVAFAQEAGAISQQPLNYGDPAHWAARAEQAEAAAGQYQLSQPTYLTDFEASQLKSALDDADIAGKLLLLGTLSEGLGDRATAVLSELSTKSHYLAQLGFLVTEGRANLAQAALHGAENSVQPSTENFNEAAREKMGNLFADRPDIRNAIISVVKGIHVDAQVRANDDPKEIGDLEDIIEQVVGGELMEMNGTTFVLPAGVETGQVNALFSAMDNSPDDVDALAVISLGGPPQRLDGTLVTPGDIAASNDVVIENEEGGSFSLRINGQYVSDPTQLNGIYRFDLALATSLVVDTVLENPVMPGLTVPTMAPRDQQP